MSSITSFYIGASAVVVLLQLISPGDADCYMHNPPGSNNRLREESENRNNGNRLFDSQNNGKGGYAWRGDPLVKGVPDELSYYPGSILPIEWTVQHGCGGDTNVECDVIIQYACEDSLPNLRDGYPTGDAVPRGNDGYEKASFESQGQSSTGTNQIPMPRISGSSGERFAANDQDFGTDTANYAANVEAFYAGETVGDYIGVEFGMHESYEYYRESCLRTERNQGLYTADRNLNGDTARYTRQNNGGTRRGFECPEERDYYPYWNPTPWRDAAVFTSDLNRCQYYQEESQNVQSKYKCVLPSDADEDTIAPISQNACESISGTWTEVPSWSMDAPACELHPESRDNHLGNTVIDENGKPVTAYYDWKVPNLEQLQGQKCVLRVRYNMSATQYEPHAEAFNPPKPMVDSSLNCDPNETGEDGRGHCSNNLNIDGLVALYNNPTVEIFDDLPSMSLAINTNQVGRTFQDRSYVFSIKNAEADSDADNCSSIFNLNVRGRRGNIVQAYPAVEYDFTKSEMKIGTEDCVHVQIHSSDFSPANGAGEGADGTDASNLVQISDATNNLPLYGDNAFMFSEEDAKALLMVGQDPQQCTVYTNNNGADEQKPDNCAKLNARLNNYEHPRLLRFNEGDYTAISTRNNNFSNRSQKWRLHVFTGSVAGEEEEEADTMDTGAVLIAAVVAGGFAAAFMGLCLVVRVAPRSQLGRSVGGLIPCLRSKADSGSAMTYLNGNPSGPATMVQQPVQMSAPIASNAMQPAANGYVYR